MSPHSADEKNVNNKKSSKSSIEGEITIDHSSHKNTNQNAKAEEKKPVAAPSVHHEKKIEPLSPPKNDQNEAVSSTDTARHPSVVVPGGVKAAAPNPSGYFRSKYESKTAPKTPLQPQSQVVQPLPANGSYNTSMGLNGISQQRKSLLIKGGIAAAIILLIAGFVFGVYIPSKPDNVYSTALQRTGDGLVAVTDKMTQEKTFTKLTKANVTGNFESKKGNETFTGTIDGKINGSSMQLSANATSKVPGAVDQNYALSLVSKQPADNQPANYYFKASGVDLLGLEGLIPGINSYNNKWIALEGDYAKSVSQNSGASLAGLFIAGPVTAGISKNDSASSAPTREDYAEILSLFSKSSQAYLFTKPGDKSVFINQGYVGKETVDGTKTYHYTLGVNKDNYVAYCKAVGEQIIQSDSYRRLARSDDDSIAADLEANNAVCDERAGSISQNQKIDMWVDSQYKVLYKLRFHESGKDNSYYEVGQKYRGKDNLQIFTNNVDGGANSNLAATVYVNLKTYTAQIKIDYNSKAGQNDTSFSLIAETKPTNEDVAVDIPAGAVPLQTAVKELKIDIDSILTPSGGLVPSNADSY